MVDVEGLFEEQRKPWKGQEKAHETVSTHVDNIALIEALGAEVVSKEVSAPPETPEDS